MLLACQPDGEADELTSINYGHEVISPSTSQPRVQTVGELENLSSPRLSHVERLFEREPVRDQLVAIAGAAETQMRTVLEPYGETDWLVPIHLLLKNVQLSINGGDLHGIVLRLRPNVRNGSQADVDGREAGGASIAGADGAFSAIDRS